FVLIIGLGERRIGLMVEKVIGEWEIVVKAVDKGWITSDLVAGASILGDGRVVLIIDVGALFQRTSLAVAAN
ncbi:MAG: two-component system chemotaxis family sensor kinase CheA, partial [bacterium]